MKDKPKNNETNIVELVIPTSQSASFLDVSIANCHIRIDEHSNLDLLKKISEVFSHD